MAGAKVLESTIPDDHIAMSHEKENFYLVLF